MPLENAKHANFEKEPAGSHENRQGRHAATSALIALGTVTFAKAYDGEEDTEGDEETNDQAASRLDGYEGTHDGKPAKQDVDGRENTPVEKPAAADSESKKKQTGKMESESNRKSMESDRNEELDKRLPEMMPGRIQLTKLSEDIMLAKVIAASQSEGM